MNFLILFFCHHIVKAHGGEIRVETREGEGSEFVIHLPLCDSPLGVGGLNPSLQQNQQGKERDWD
jgi:hypothetical protein